MASAKTKIKPIRIANETADYFEGKPLNRMVESLHHHLENGRVRFDGEDLQFGGLTGEMQAIMSEIGEMSLCFGVTVENMLGQFCELLNDGVMTVDRGVLKVMDESWVESFREACHDMCIPVEKAGENAAKAVRRRQI